ncbi:RNA polymerase sigma factor RpoD/SigA [Mucilaginibacter sp. KACC 22773]|nr:RNA polymerase sigma factor RpoD/SigA [Mucilaginibacter sp. KACC 22773]WDF81478.1 RNA polymerase sigma factor RpoD/SigA [Mucilaginibacter sp. KACC 22773]
MRQLNITQSFTNLESQCVEYYFHEIGKLKMISAEEEVLLAQKIRQGDKAALERLTTANLRFVVSIAKKYLNQGLPLSDLISEGNLGLLKAAEKFDETRGFKFISCAVWWIRQSILEALGENTRMLRLPHNQVNLLTKINRVTGELEGRLERTPTPDELAEVMNLPVENIVDAYSHSKRTVSYDTPISAEDEFTLLEKLGNQDEGIIEVLSNESLRILVGRLLKQLTRREQTIIELSYGFNNERAMCPTEVAGIIGLTGERVRQIKLIALDKLREKIACVKNILLELTM